MLMVKSVYLRQSHLLVRCLPEIGKRSCFALKGGTAINFFFRPLPRLSVDIDLAFVKDGETGGARTRDHKLKRLVLYLLSYRPINPGPAEIRPCFYSTPSAPRKQKYPRPNIPPPRTRSGIDIAPPGAYSGKQAAGSAFNHDTTA